MYAGMYSVATSTDVRLFRSIDYGEFSNRLATRDSFLCRLTHILSMHLHANFPLLISYPISFELMQ